MGMRLESFGGSLENPKRVEHIDSIDGLGLFEYPSKGAINAYLDTIGDTRKIEAFNTAFSRFSRAIEHAHTIEDYDTIFRDICIYEDSVILSFEQRSALLDLMFKCSAEKSLLQMKEDTIQQEKTKPLDHVDEFKEIDYSSIFHDPVSSPDESLIPSNPPQTQVDEELSEMRELRELLAQIGDSKPSIEPELDEFLQPSNPTQTQDDDSFDKIMQEILDSVDDTKSSVDIVPTKEPVKAKVHVIKARKKKVPKKVTIKKITKPGLPGEMLEEDTSNLTKRR
jgi:hypothetical protein